MKNPAEETTVRPNQNQTMGKLNQPDPVLQLILYEKEPQLFPHQSQDDYSTKAGNRLSLFWHLFSKNCHEKRPLGRPSDDFTVQNQGTSHFPVRLFGLP